MALGPMRSLTVLDMKANGRTANITAKAHCHYLTVRFIPVNGKMTCLMDRVS